MKIIILPYIEPKKSQRTWLQKGYVAQIGRQKVNLKERVIK